MYPRPYYKAGTHNTLCAQCGFMYKKSQLRKRYDGLWVCDKDWEERPKQELPPRRHRGTVMAKDVIKDTGDD